MARTEAEVEALRAVWKRVPVTNIDADIDYFLEVVRHAASVVRPHVVIIEREGENPILVAARLARQEYPLRIGYRTLARVCLGTLVVAFDGVLGARAPEDYDLVVAALLDSLAAGEADAVMFQQVELTAPLADSVRAVPRRRRETGSSVVHWTAKLPDSWEALLAQRSAKSRRQLRYDDSRFIKRYVDRWTLRRLDLPEYLDRLEDELAAVAEKTYQHGLGVGTNASPLQRHLRRLALERGWLRVWMLYIDERPVSFWWGTAYGGVLTIGSPGYDPAFAHDRAGYFTLRRMLEDLCADPDVSVIDFGHGDADYKERFGTESTDSANLFLFAGRAKPFASHAMLLAHAKAQTGVRLLLSRSGYAESLKRRWRSRAARDEIATRAPGGRPTSGR